ncbi:hypothetical protein Tco_1486887, partial [Tanacetum coccineum]
SSVKDKILATPSETSKVKNALAEMLCDLDQQMEKRADDGKANVVIDVFSRKERVKPRRVRAMAMTIQYEVPLVESEMDKAHASRQSEHMIQALEDIMRACVIDFGGSYHSSIRCASFEASYGRKLSIKEKFKAVRDRQKSYVGNRRNPLEFEVRDRVLLKVSPWKGVVRLVRKGKLAPRYVGPFKILERTGLKCLGNANLHVSLNEIKTDMTLRFVKEPVEIMDREIKSLKRSRIPLVKVR